MKRRDFLAATLSIAGVFSPWPLRAQNQSNRGAVVIGVDQIVGQPKLKAAASGAKEIAAWLDQEKFDVKLFADDSAPVTAHALVGAIKDFINRGTLEQLVIYFAGHGFISGSLSEFWLLSGAPEDPNEAVSLTESRAYARHCGIPNVVFISDACRSRANTLGVEGLHGSIVFPTGSFSSNVTGDVDVFLATRVDASAYEVPVKESAAAYEGVYTSCFLDAYKHPDSTMVATVDGKPVIPNRRLRNYLAREVPKRAQAVQSTLNQQPDAEIDSDEPTFIGHVIGAPRAGGIANPTVGDVAVSALKDHGIGNAVTSFPAAKLQAAAVSTGFNSARDTIVYARGLTHESKSRSGFVIYGGKVVSVATHPAIKASIVNSGANGRPTAFIDVDAREARAASVALRFADGSGTVLAALDQYIGNVVVDRGQVSNVSYMPSPLSPMRSIYEQEEARLAQLHGAVATAAQFGAFRIEGPEATRKRSAAQLAGRIRILKSIDPTLGLYAAYAYADAGLRESVGSVRSFMHETLGIDLFDVAMLSGALSGRRIGDLPGTVPFCPMLSQGWSLFRVNNIRLPESIAAVPDYLRVSLWLTLELKGMDIVENALRKGALK
ncbi:caspase family protein [Burkholderia sp. DN3021]|uniref:caspase family protein n=1 Tax=Burkholderia sp. DN3021 TaxID=3410137 RepID=UPI003C7BC82B